MAPQKKPKMHASQFAFLSTFKSPTNSSREYVSIDSKMVHAVIECYPESESELIKELTMLREENEQLRGTTELLVARLEDLLDFSNFDNYHCPEGDLKESEKSFGYELDSIFYILEKVKARKEHELKKQMKDLVTLMDKYRDECETAQELAFEADQKCRNYLYVLEGCKCCITKIGMLKEREGEWRKHRLNRLQLIQTKNRTDSNICSVGESAEDDPPSNSPGSRFGRGFRISRRRASKSADKTEQSVEEKASSMNIAQTQVSPCTPKQEHPLEAEKSQTTPDKNEDIWLEPSDCFDSLPYTPKSRNDTEEHRTPPTPNFRRRSDLGVSLFVPFARNKSTCSTQEASRESKMDSSLIKAMADFQNTSDDTVISSGSSIYSSAGGSTCYASNALQGRSQRLRKVINRPLIPRPAAVGC